MVSTVTPPSSDGYIYISPNGKEGGDGTKENPYQGCSFIVPGDSEISIDLIPDNVIYLITISKR